MDLIASGRFYPPKCNTPEERLRYCASQFPLVEVDSSYYAMQDQVVYREKSRKSRAGGHQCKNGSGAVAPNPLNELRNSGAPGRIRTHDPLVRSRIFLSKAPLLSTSCATAALASLPY
jgi:uncharacterized protein DUF72